MEWNSITKYPAFDPPNPSVALPLLSQLFAAGSSSSLSYSFVATPAARTSLSSSSSSSSHLALLSSVLFEPKSMSLAWHPVICYGSGSWSALLLSPRYHLTLLLSIELSPDSCFSRRIAFFVHSSGLRTIELPTRFFPPFSHYFWDTW